MSMNEENFAYKVRHALNEKLEEMPESITQRLEQARRLAVSRKKKSAPVYISVFQQVFAGQAVIFPAVCHGWKTGNDFACSCAGNRYGWHFPP